MSRQEQSEVDKEYKAILDAIPDSMVLYCGDLYRMWAYEKECISRTGHRMPVLVNIQVPR